MGIKTSPSSAQKETQPDNGEAEEWGPSSKDDGVSTITDDTNSSKKCMYMLKKKCTQPKSILIFVMAIVIFALSMSILSKNRKYKRLEEENQVVIETAQVGFPEERPCPLVFKEDEESPNKDPTEMEGCSSRKIMSILLAGFDETNCPWDFNYDLQLRTLTFSREKAIQYLDYLCLQAESKMWDQTSRKKWVEHVDARLNPNFLTELLVDGGTELNLKTGNLQNSDGTDPRTNDNYPTDETSFQVGRSVRSFYELYGTSTILTNEPSFDSYDYCQHQTIMCCYKRDRQFGDGNGNCQSNDCDDASPGDNTNLCYHNDENYLGEDETIHCHGFAWSNNETHVSTRLRFNTMFYSFFYDHWYTRGYVESILPGDAPMCGCIEDMPTVVRADCSEPYLRTKYSVRVVSEDDASTEKKREGAIDIVPGALNVDFRSCRGTPANNDLASKIEQLNLDGDLDDGTKELIFQQYLVGYDNPNDNNNEAACEAAWEREIQGSVVKPSSMMPDEESSSADQSHKHPYKFFVGLMFQMFWLLLVVYS